MITVLLEGARHFHTRVPLTATFFVVRHLRIQVSVGADKLQTLPSLASRDLSRSPSPLKG